jgi:hypothetical protein
MVKYLSFHNSSFALRYFLIQMARSQHDTPPFFFLFCWCGFLKFLNFEFNFGFIWRPKMDERLLRSFMGYLSRAWNAPSSQGLGLCVNVGLV